MSDPHNRLVVITGGPGAGKTTLIEALADAGYAHSAEAGRGIIRDQQVIGGNALPWRDPPLFAEMMLCWEMRSYTLAQQDQRGVVFFDRGVPDVIGYLRLHGRTIPAHIQRAARHFRYARRVFIAPPWPEIFRQDAERRQDPGEAECTYRAMVASYTELGYQLVNIPRLPPAARAQFVLSRLED